MAYVVAATWRARAGEEKKIEEVIRVMTRLSREEPGTLMFEAHRSAEDPAVFFLYEQFRDAAAFEAHTATPHFENYVRGQAIPRLESRERAVYETLD
jgi:(4S)-4-hydroxy-5-phosphonooxypentane-2,3-dione isomerase